MRRFWGWELATYLFLGGLGGGMLTFAMVLGLIVYPSELWQLASSVLVFGVLIAIIVLAVGTGLLVFELGQWKVFYRAFVTKTAVIKWGAVLLSVAMIFAGLFLLWSITWLTFFPFIPYEGLAKFFLGVAGVAGFCVMVYTGVLLSSLKARPFWNTPALPVLFTVSALSTGACLLSLCVGVFPFPQEWLLEPFAGDAVANPIVPLVASELIESMKHLLHLVDAVLIVAEILVLMLYVMLQFCASNKFAKAVADKWVRGSWAPIFWGLMLCCGLIIPLILNLAGGIAGEFFSPVIALLGGLLLRFMILWSCDRRLEPGEEKFYTRLPQGHADFMDYWAPGKQYWTEVASSAPATEAAAE